MSATILAVLALWLLASFVAAIGIGRAVRLGRMCWPVALGLREASDFELWEAGR